MAQGNHVWSFSTVGGVRRVNIESGNDLLNLADLDPKLWTALSCPVNDLEIDRKTLELIDTDKDGQIKVPEIIAAVNWMASVLKNPQDLLQQSSVFPLSAINEESETGRILLDSAHELLKNLDNKDAAILTVAETSDIAKIFANTRFNGDGIITTNVSSDLDIIRLINEIMQCCGSATDRGGVQGVSLEHVTMFFAECGKYLAWHNKMIADSAGILPFGADTEAVFAYYTVVKAKIDDYFIRCRLAVFDPQSADMLNLQTARVELITEKDLSGCIEEIAGYPLAKINVLGTLNLKHGINPAWEKQIHLFHALFMKMYPAKDVMTEVEWHTLKQAFIPYTEWISAKEGTAVEALGLGRIQELMQGNQVEELMMLIGQDKAVENEVNNIILVDKVVRYYRDLYTLIKNFVTFHDFYTPGTKAIFQAGTLYIDQRSCDLCIRVNDMSKQSSLASYSGMFLIYCDCISRSANKKMTVVAALTNGDIDNLVVGRNALFYDRKGEYWDATVVKIIDNPISIRQAFFSPYRKLSMFIEKQVNKIAASEDEKNSATMTKNIESIPIKADEVKPKKEPPAPVDVGKFVGIFAAIGLAIGAIGTALASVIGGFMKLVWWKMPFAVLGVLMLISGPSMIMAFLKLRKRNLAPILDANGWAINARVTINIQFGRTLTHLAELPKGAKINIVDPFSNKKRPFLPYVLMLSIVAGIVLILLWKNGLIHIHF